MAQQLNYQYLSPTQVVCAKINDNSDVIDVKTEVIKKMHSSFMILQKLSLIYSEILAMTSGVLAETIIESLVLAFFTMYMFFHEGF